MVAGTSKAVFVGTLGASRDPGRAGAALSSVAAKNPKATTEALHTEQNRGTA
jgi:hypothetical protein